MNKVMALLFALACLGTATVSSRLLGVGMWFWVFLVSGGMVFVFQFISSLIPVARVIALFMVIISVASIALTLLASTIGGSSGMGEQETLLVLGFVGMALFGFILARVTKPKVKQSYEELDD